MSPVGTFWTVLPAVCILAAMGCGGSAAGRAERPRVFKPLSAARTVRVAMYSGEGTDPDPLVRALVGWGFQVRKIGPDDLRGLRRDAFDVLYFPGGWYRLEDDVNAAVLRYVQEGGGCVGTCAGAYVVAGHIPIIPGRVLRSNMRGRLYLEPQQGDHPILRGAVQPCRRHSGRKWEPIAVTHLGGPLILPDDKSAIIASYDFEGEVGAIVAARIGKGRAVALASHPELRLAALPGDDPVRKGPETLLQGDEMLIVRNAVLWAAGVEVPQE